MNPKKAISLLTGPLFDHTRKDHLGRYLLAQGSGNTALTKFYFKTPAVDLTYGENFCLSFWYLMFGSDILSLKIDMNVPRFRQSKQQIFQKSNEQSTSKVDWRYAQIKLKIPPLTDSTVVAKYQNVIFTFIATRGPSYVGISRILFVFS